MNARQLVTDTVRHGYRNLVGTIVVSVLVSLSVVPLAAMATVGTPSAVLAGLWATCLLLGIVLVGGFRFATTVAAVGASRSRAYYVLTLALATLIHAAYNFGVMRVYA